MTGRTPDEGTLARLDLAERSMRETLRLHPAGSISPRQAAEDVDVARLSHQEGDDDPVVALPGRT